MSIWSRKKSEKDDTRPESQLVTATKVGGKGLASYRGSSSEVEKWVSKGHEHYEKEEHEKAIQFYKKALTGGPNDKIVYNNIGASYRSLGDFKKSDEALNKALNLDKKYVLAWENKGFLYADANKYDKAIDYLEKTIDLDRKRYEPWARLGLIHYEREDFEKSIEAYEKALELNPNNVDVLNNEALAYHRLSQMREERESIEMLERAVERLEQAIDAEPHRVHLWNNMGIIYGFLGRLKASLSSLDRAIALSPELGTPYFNKARIYIQLGDERKAMEELKKSVERDNDLWEGAMNDFTLRKITATEEFLEMNPDKPKHVPKAKKAKKKKRKHK